MRTSRAAHVPAGDRLPPPRYVRAGRGPERIAQPLPAPLMGRTSATCCMRRGPDKRPKRRTVWSTARCWRTRSPPSLDRRTCDTRCSSPGSITTSAHSRRTPTRPPIRRSGRARIACRTRTSMTTRRMCSFGPPTRADSPGQYTGPQSARAHSPRAPRAWTGHAAAPGTPRRAPSRTTGFDTRQH